MTSRDRSRGMAPSHCGLLQWICENLDAGIFNDAAAVRTFAYVFKFSKYRLKKVIYKHKEKIVILQSIGII